MRCISPLRLRSGDIVPCGKCNFCLMSRRIDWSFRLAQELKVASSAKFITMTYSDDKLHFDQHGIPVLDKRDVQLFLKRLRKDFKCRYYCVGEYGENTERPHYHVLLFNLPLPAYAFMEKYWQLGQCHVGDVTPASIYYTCKYHVNGLGRSDGRAPPFALMSRRPGIGSNYISSHKSWHRQGMRNYTQVNGQIGRLPRFYKEKFFSDIERMALALEAVRLGDEKYWSEIVRLSKVSEDPFIRYEAGIAAMCENVTVKSKFSSKF